MGKYKSTDDNKTELQWLTEGFVLNVDAVGNVEWNNSYCVFLVKRYPADQVHSDPEKAAELLLAHRKTVRDEWKARQPRSILTRIAGVTFDDDATGNNRQSIIGDLVKRGLLEPGCKLLLTRESDNEHDTNAIAVSLPHSCKLGYINRSLAMKIAPMMDKGRDLCARVNRVLGDGDEYNYGVEIRVTAYKIDESWWLALVRKLIRKGLSYRP